MRPASEILRRRRVLATLASGRSAAGSLWKLDDPSLLRRQVRTRRGLVSSPGLFWLSHSRPWAVELCFLVILPGSFGALPARLLRVVHHCCRMAAQRDEKKEQEKANQLKGLVSKVSRPTSSIVVGVAQLCDGD